MGQLVVRNCGEPMRLNIKTCYRVMLMSCDVTSKSDGFNANVMNVLYDRIVVFISF
jgi:hypothetical protein